MPEAVTTFEPSLVQLVPIDDLTLDPRNARAHSRRNLDAIIGSLKRFGQQKPIIADKDNVVRAGNGVLRAAKLSGWTEIAVYSTGLEAEEATAFAVADNRVAELSEWDVPMLAEAIEDASDAGISFDALGFTDEELNKILSDAVPEPDFGEDDDDELPEGEGVPTSTIRLVQVFLSPEQHEQFNLWERKLRDRMGLDNISDSVYRAMRIAAGDDA